MLLFAAMLLSFSQRFRTSLSFAKSPHLFSASLLLLSAPCLNFIVSSALRSFAALHHTLSHLGHTSYHFAASVNSELRRTTFKVRLTASQFYPQLVLLLRVTAPFLFTKFQTEFAYFCRYLAFVLFTTVVSKINSC